MALPTEPTYSTNEEFQAWTPVSTQASMVEDDWKPFALRAEKIVDTYVRISDAQKYDPDQDLKFPIKNPKNGSSLIPSDVTLATIYITSGLILKGDPSASDFSNASSESWDGSGYSVSNGSKSTTNSSQDIKVTMPPEALRLLMPWSNKNAPATY